LTEVTASFANGFFRVTTMITGPNGEQEPRLKRIPNWATVYMDPDAREADFSDGEICFVTDSMSEKAFKRKYPKAKKQSFTASDKEIAHDFFHGSNIVIAEYWTREPKEAADGETTWTVTQRITNGVEVLETNEWLGSSIPIVPVVGKELYVREGGGGTSKRMFFSMIRRGRTAQTMMAYIASQESEEFGQMPRASWVGWKGMFANADKTWDIAHRVPIARLEAILPPDWQPSWGAPQLPTRPQFQPNPEPYEMAYERWRRSHQAAVAGTPLPTDVQKVNDKSGIALERIENAGMLGNFHFTDNFVRALRFSGDQINELITKLAETNSLPQQLLGKDKKGEDITLHVVGKDFVPPEESEHLPEANYFFAHRGRFSVTISEGPSYQSEREEQAAFADTLFKTIAPLAEILPPGTLAKVLSLAVRMKNLGTFSDEIADTLNPQDQSAQQLQMAQQQLAMGQQVQAELKTELDKLRLEKAGKVIDNEYKLQLKQIEGAFDAKMTQLNNDIKVLIAEIQAKSQDSAERVQMYKEFWLENHGAAHEAGLQAAEQAHEHALADKQAIIAQQQAAANPQEPSPGE
jgi:hypothetical protein